jgi:hypothetical protein
VAPQYWLLLGIGVVTLVVVGFSILRNRASSRTGLVHALDSVAIERLQDVLVPDGMGGQIHVEHLLLTGTGLVVLDVKEYEGTVFASDRMEEWTVIGKAGRFTFPNPLVTLYDRVAALRQLVRDVPVAGYVLFDEGADFSKGRPKDVILPAELLDRHAKPERGELERLLESFLPHWDRVKSVTEPVEIPPPRA